MFTNYFQMVQEKYMYIYLYKSMKDKENRSLRQFEARFISSQCHNRSKLSQPTGVSGTQQAAIMFVYV